MPVSPVLVLTQQEKGRTGEQENINFSVNEGHRRLEVQESRSSGILEILVTS
jgi:hypothetical protein